MVCITFCRWISNYSSSIWEAIYTYLIPTFPSTFIYYLTYLIDSQHTPVAHHRSSQLKGTFREILHLSQVKQRIRAPRARPYRSSTEATAITSPLRTIKTPTRHRTNSRGSDRSWLTPVTRQFRLESQKRTLSTPNHKMECFCLNQYCKHCRKTKCQRRPTATSSPLANHQFLKTSKVARRAWMPTISAITTMKEVRERSQTKDRPVFFLWMRQPPLLDTKSILFQ